MPTLHQFLLVSSIGKKMCRQDKLITLCFSIFLLAACASGKETYQANRYLSTVATSDPITSSCGTSHKPQTWGVVIGINEYQDDGITDLKGSVYDAWIFYHYLTSPSGGGV